MKHLLPSLRHRSLWFAALFLLFCCSNAHAGWGDKFTAVINGYEVEFAENAPGTVSIGYDMRCISQDVSGTFVIPSAVVKPGTNVAYTIVAVGNNAFYGCNKLTKVVLPHTVSEIRYSAFYNCTALQEIELSSELESIFAWAFYNCSALTSITFPSTLTTIMDEAFCGCNSITSIHLPASVERLNSPFYNMKNLSEFTVDPANSRFYTIDGVLYGEKTDGRCELVHFPMAKNFHYFTVPTGVTDIGNYAFYGATYLWSCIIPEGVKTIGQGAFSYANLRRCQLPESLDNILLMAFSHSNLESIVIPPSVKSVGDYAFEECSKLKMVSIFNTKLSSASSSGNKFYHIHPSACLAVPPEYVSAYQNAPWTSWFSKVVAGYAVDDYNFGNLLTSFLDYKGYDINGDGILCPDELNSVTELMMSGWDETLSTVKNLGLFPNLEKFYCSENYGLTGIDVSQNAKLRDLNLYDCSLITSLDVTHNPELERLSCDYCSLRGTLDLSHCPRIEEVWCEDNYLTALNLSGCHQLAFLHCEDNLLKTLDVSECNWITELWCYSNFIGSGAMTTLVDDLPDRTWLLNGEVEFILGAFGDPDTEGNVLSKYNCDKARAKGWKVLDAWYEPYDGVDIATTVDTPPAAAKSSTGWHGIDGRRLPARPAKPGIYVKDGKKVLVRQ